MKKFFCSLFAFTILSIGAYCDMYFMLGADFGYANMAGNSGYYFGGFFDVQYYPFDGPIGLGVDLKARMPLIKYKDHKYQYRYTDPYNRIDEIRTLNSNTKYGGSDFMVAPTLSLRLFYKKHNNVYPVLKVFPVFAYSKHQEFEFVHLLDKSNSSKTIKEQYIGYGAEICLNKQSLWGVYPKLGTQFFVTYNHGKLLDTNEKYFSIGLGVRFYYRKSLLEERAAEKARLEAAQKQREYEARKAQIRQQEEQERLQAEALAIESGSLRAMIEFLNQYGDSANIRFAIEQVLSNNKNQSYKELSHFDNPYSFERGSVYYCSALDVYQWVSEYSFLAKVNGKIIYVETSNIENVKSRITHAFLKANGVLEYNTATSSLNIVPKFTLMLFNGIKIELD